MDISLPTFVRRVHTNLQKRIPKLAKTNSKAQSDQILNFTLLRKIAITLALGACVSLGFQKLKDLDIHQNLSQKIVQTATLDALLRTKGLQPLPHRTSIQIQNKLSEELAFEASGQHYWISESLPRVVVIRSFESGQAQWMVYGAGAILQSGLHFGAALQGWYGFAQLESIPIQQQLKSSNPTRYRDPIEIVF